MENNISYTLEERKQKIISDLQDFLNHKRANSIDFGYRLIQSFKVSDFSTNGENIFVKFEGYDDMPHTHHYYVQKKEFEDFQKGNKKIGISLLIDDVFVEDNRIILEVNLIKNGFRKPTIREAERFKGIYIKHLGKFYKSYDVQVHVDNSFLINKIIRIFVFEPTSAESYVDNHTILQNKMEIKNGITFEDFGNQEYFVRKFDVLQALKMERKSVIDELTSWFSLNISNKIDEQFSGAFMKKIQEIA